MPYVYGVLCIDSSFEKEQRPRKVGLWNGSSLQLLLLYTHSPMVGISAAAASNLLYGQVWTPPCSVHSSSVATAGFPWAMRLGRRQNLCCNNHHIHECKRLKTITIIIVIDQAQFTVACMPYRTLSLISFQFFLSTPSNPTRKVLYFTLSRPISSTAQSTK